MAKISKYEILNIAMDTEKGKNAHLDLQTLSSSYDAIVEALETAITTASPEDKIILHPLGTFTVKETTQREFKAHNIRTGEEETKISLGAKRVVFKSTRLKNIFREEKIAEILGEDKGEADEEDT